MQAIKMSNELHECTQSGDLERVQQLVEGGANIEETDEEGMTALLLASLEDHFEIMVYLVEHGANVAHGDEGGMTALHWACIDGNLSSVRYLLEHGASIAERDHKGRTLYFMQQKRGICRWLNTCFLLRAARA
jgi:ankyrin repeat protein